MKHLLVLTAAAALAAPAFAQATTGTMPATTPATGAAATGTTAGATATTGTATAGAPQVTVGAAVSDTSGASVGTVSAVANGNATVDTGTAKAAIPVASFAKGQNGLVIAMTKAQLEAAVAANTKPPEFTVGSSVVGPQGNPVGKVTSAAADLVTVEMTDGAKVQLPKNAFAQKAPGTLVIGMTPAELSAAAKAAAPGGK